MSLRLKFNLSLLAVMALGLAVSGYFLRDLAQKNARDEVLKEAGLMMESALAIRTYTVDQVRPRLQKQLEDEFMPQTVPAFAATETLSVMRKKYPEYSYKEATLNPTNPRDKAEDWEAKVVEAFRTDGGLKETSGVRATHLGPSLYIARPIKIGNGACLACHSEPSAAPASMIRTYGDQAGFGWKLNEIVGAQVVSVPMTVPLKRAQVTFYASLGALVAIFFAMFVILNVLLDRLVIKPIMKMSAAADAISVGKFDLAQIDASGTDEVARLAQSFNRMTTSLAKAMQLLRGRPAAAAPSPTPPSAPAAARSPVKTG
jgi:protein-histidine pros-kinase